ncbi:MAG: tetratricopeptide repeat protein [Wenzhouxiangella sp.]
MSIFRATLLLAASLGLMACGTGGQLRDSRVAEGEALWNQLGPDSVQERVPEPEAFLGQLFVEPLSAESCRVHRAAIEHYLARIPVDLSFWRIARDCAGLLDDPAWYAESQRMLDRLVSYALADGRSQAPWNPAMVLHADDIFALADEQGKTIKWLRYLSMGSVRHFLLEASVVDARGEERREYFDLLDALLRLNSDDPNLRYPGARRTMKFGQLEAAVFEGDLLAMTGYLNIDMESGEVNPIAARRALQRAWDAGLPGAGLFLGEVCLMLEDAGCTPELIDDVIEGLIELEIAEGWALKAVSVLMANGFDLDDPTVDDAFEQAGRLSAPDRMFYYAADVLTTEMTEPNSPQAAAADALIGNAADLGHGMASLQLAVRLLTSEDESSHPSGQALLDQAVAADIPIAIHLKGVWAGPPRPEAMALIRRAAMQGLPESQFVLGMTLSFLGDDDSQEIANEWFRKAGHGGHARAMRLLAQRYLTGRAGKVDAEVAQAWLLSGWIFDDLESAAWLAALYVIHPELDTELDEPGLELALRLYEDFGTEAASLIVNALTGVEPFNQDSDRVSAMLKQLSAAGMAEASLELGEQYQFGEGRPLDLAAAEAWYELAFEQGSAEAMYVLGGMLLYDLNRLDDAVDAFARGAEENHEWASNDLAYLLCTGQLGVARDPERGLQVISALFDRTESPHHYQYSTLAACQAATGEMEQALVNHRHALEQTKALEPLATDVHEDMERRLALYEAGQPYIWEP